MKTCSHFLMTGNIINGFNYMIAVDFIGLPEKKKGFTKKTPFVYS